MRPICWLHISDLHLRAGHEWAQDVVLKAMCQQIEQLRQSGTGFDFALVTGDIAFSGKTREYALAEKFFTDLEQASGIPIERMYCVPGNHDIDRDRQNLCFKGGRAELTGPSQVDALLAGGEDLDTLLTREENYRRFQKSFFLNQDRTPTPDGLAYVSRVSIEEARLAIVGLDSAWLAEGGPEDHGNLLIGERQAISALNMATECDDPPHILIGMAHHPVHLLQQFDRLPVQNQIEDALHFFHCGHLHEPEMRLLGRNGSSCLSIAAGASFETRQSRNSFSKISIDLQLGVRNVEVFEYIPQSVLYSSIHSSSYEVEPTQNVICDVGEFAQAIQQYHPPLTPIVFYLSALALGKKNEVLISTSEPCTFGPYEVMRDLAESEVVRKTNDFLNFRNVLTLLYGRASLPEILAQHGHLIAEYGKALILEYEENAVVRSRLENYDRDCQLLAGGEPQVAFAHIISLLTELAEAQDWSRLREQAQRLLNFRDSRVATQAKRMMALALANSEHADDKRMAIEHYRSLIELDVAVFSDLGNLAILLGDTGETNQAGIIVLEGMGLFPQRARHFYEIGQQIVAASGDRDLRIRLDAAMRVQE